MCGITGFTGKKDLKLLDNMLENIEHRGRDERCAVHTGQVNLGMNRLAILDLQQDIYPFYYKHYTLVFNGEIYNFAKFKKKLAKQGIKFSTNSDAEIILPLYNQYGSQAFEMLEGMFAIAIVDSEKQELILARDKSGEKPLYFYQNQQSLAFSSEIKNLIGLLKSKPTISRPELEQYLREGSLVETKTLVKNIQKLPPGSCGVWSLKQNTLVIDPYWQPQYRQPTNLPVDKAVDQLESLLAEAVSSRLMADVPVGSFMSGGVDSTLLTYFAKQSIPDLKTYSVSFPGYKDDESRFSHLAAEHLQTNHTEVICTPEKVRPIIENIGHYVDEPIVDTAVLPTFLMVQEARKAVKVTLSGEGADELFGGYDRYYKYLKAKQLASLLPEPIWKKLAQVVPGRFRDKFNRATIPLSQSYSSQNIWTPEELGQLLVNSRYQPQAKYPTDKLFREQPLKAMQLTDYRHYLAEQLLMKVDKFSMIHNLESRAPYLDTKLVNFALSLPDKYKHQPVGSKYLLRKLAERYLPKEISWRAKHGFVVPLDNWFRSELRDVVENMTEQLSKLPKVFNLKYLQQIKEEHLAGQKQHRDKIWSLVVLSKWLEKHQAEITI
jgi:asparagine synthase (glutamine-hydrolysing)